MGSSGPRPALLPVVALVAGLALLALATGLVGWRWVGGGVGFEPGVLVPLVLLGALGVLLRERALGPHIGVSVTTVVLAAAIPLVGPHGAALVGLLAYAGDVRQRHWRPRLFNAAMAGALGGVGGLAYVALGGAVGVPATGRALTLLLEVALPLVAAYALMMLVNAWAIAAMSAVVRGTRVQTVAVQALRSLGWGYLTHVVIGFLFVVLWGPLGLKTLAALFILGPLLIAHWTIGREALARREHQETVTSFVAALEQAEPTSAGHSARVAELSEQLGDLLGVRSAAVEELRYAALLHDIGLVAVRTELPADAEPDEITLLSALSSHPEAGVAVLRGLDFLEGALPAIAHHHERFDGHGYPSGLVGEAIPRAARIIAVADAFDALTATLDGHALAPSEALRILRARAGTHLDPEVVEGLATVLARHRPAAAAWATPGGLPGDVPGDTRGGAPGREPGLGLGGRRLPDHDLPAFSDAFARWQPESAPDRVGRS